MSDETTPELRALAEQLFAAGRAERPGPALGRRLLLIEPASTSRVPRLPASGAAPRIIGSTSRARSFWVGAATATVFAAGRVGVGWSLGQGPVIDMSPDPVSARARPAPMALSQSSQSSQSSQPSAPELGAVSPSMTTAPVARDVERVPALGEAPARAPARVAAPKRLLPKRATREAPPAERSHATAAVRERGAAPPADGSPATPGANREPLAPAPASALGLSEELALLKEARFALRAGEPTRALEVLDRQTRARAADGLHAEATLLRIEALDALGRRAEASQLAARFVRENPFNALADRAKSFIGASGAAP